MLEVRDLCAGYRGVQVLWSVSMDVGASEFVALIGANGAGKTTFINALSGIVPATSGSIIFEGQDITKLSASARVRLGICQVPEGRKLFSGMTVEQNLRLGAFLNPDREDAERELGRIYSLFPELERRAGQLAGTLSGGEQQMVAIGRALMSRPRLLLVDELSLGLAPVAVERIAEKISALHKESRLSVLLVEQDVSLALELAGRGYVLETGAIRMSGSSPDLLQDDNVRRAYLGL